MKKIVLLWPINMYYSPNLSLLYQGKFLKEKGYDANIVFSNLLFSDDNTSLPKEAEENPEKALEKIIKTVEKIDPEILYIGSWREHSPFVHKFCKKFKRINPNVIIINGGHNPTFVPEKVLKLTKEIDYLISGEGEYTLPTLIDSIKHNKNINHVNGIIYLDKKGKIKKTENSKEKKDIDNLPIIDYEDVLGKIPSRIDMRTSRGCLMDCHFCNLQKMWPKPVRYHSNDYVIKQMKHLENLYGLDYVHFIDEMFLCKIDRADKLTGEIQNNFPGIKWGGMIRNEFVNEKLINSLTKNGFSNAAVGIESNNPKVLKFLNKTPNISNYISKINNTINILKEKLDTLEVGLISGTPVENSRDIIDLVDFIKNIKEKKGNLDVLKIALGKLNVYPGTKLWKDYESGKFKLRKDLRRYSKYENYFEREIEKEIWTAPRFYTIENKNFRTWDEYFRFLKLVFDESIAE